MVGRISPRAGFGSTSRALAVCVVVGYLGLAFIGAACLFGAVPMGHAAHHHHAGSAGKVSHSPLCAWACQVGSAALHAGTGEHSCLLGTLLWLLLLEAGLLSCIYWSAARPRSPPILFPASI